MQLAGIALIVPCALITALLLAVASLLASRCTFYKKLIDQEIGSERFHAIDGLRGFLALGVLFHHSVITYFYYLKGSWDVPPSRLATFFGQGGVAMFFMVTAFLFWNRALIGGARFDAKRFFWSRLCRMVPMFWFSAALLIITAFALTHFRMNVSFVEIARQIVSWLTFTIPGNPDVNGFKNTFLINTVYWSLVYEWKFYLLFPLLALFAEGWAALVPALVSAILIALFSQTHVEWYFLYGALAATLGMRSAKLKQFATTRFASVVVVGLFVCIAMFVPTVYRVAAAPLLFLPFLLIANGNTLFGLLTCRPARVLGAISYSIYLLHNFVLYLIVRLVNHFVAIPTMAVVTYWCVISVVAITTVLLRQ